MALIICYECSNAISDMAKNCPHCGAPKIAGEDKIQKEQIQEKIDSAQKEYDENQKNTSNKMSKVKKHTIISSLLLIPGAMLFTSAHSSSYTLLSVIFYYFFIAFFVFILAISVYFLSSLFKKKLSFDKTLYRCCYLAAFLYLIDITHLDLCWLIGWLIGRFG